MNPEVKEKWLAALRSGKYKQGKDQLRLGDNFCCLGVLCDLYNPNLWDKLNDEVYIFENEALTNLPPSVEEWSGLLDDSKCDLAQLNDNGKTFEEIADIIEKEF